LSLIHFLLAIPHHNTQPSILPLPSLPSSPFPNPEFRDIQDTIDGLVTDYFARDPVLTSLNFIVPLNGMIYSTRKMSAECVKFVQAVRELMLREKKIGKGVVSVAAATAAVAVLGAENISCSGDGAERGMGARKKVGGGGKGGGTVNE